MRYVALAVLVGCAHGGGGGGGAAAPWSPPSGALAGAPAPKARAVDARVLEMTTTSPYAILVGPFLVTSINPGGGLSLGLSVDGRCDDVTWFGYSGGGVAIPDGETLCAVADDAGAQAFSGHQ